MTEAEILELIADGESMTVEFKAEEKKPLSDNELIEAVVCMANAEGGYIIVGVEDDGRITGARPKHQDAAGACSLIANKTVPSLYTDVRSLAVKDVVLLLIEVPHCVTAVATSTGKYLRRAIGGDSKPCCRPFFHHEMQSHYASHGRFDYSNLVVTGASWDDLDPLEFERMRRYISENPGRGDNAVLNLPDVEAAKALGIIDSETEIRVAALLLFGRRSSIRKFIPSHEVAFQVLEGTAVKVNDFFRWPLLRVMGEFMTRFRARYSEEEIIFGMLRIAIPNYAENSFREAVANALIHRDYQRLEAVHVQWHRDCIQISSPGGFVEGVRLDNLLVTPPKARNPLLADAFKRIGLVERTGRGIDSIFEGQVRYGRPAPNYSQSDNTQVTVILNSPPANLALARFIAQQESERGTLSLDSLLILNELHHQRRLDVDAVSQLIQKDVSVARSELERLVEYGIIEAKGERRGRTYHLSAAAYKAMGEKAGYVRTRDIEAIRQPELIMEWVQKHGSIKREDVVELLKVKEQQASYLLRKLVGQNRLILSGMGRKAYYVRANKSKQREDNPNGQ